MEQTSEDRLRAEFKDQLKAQADFLVVGGVSRHEKALLRIDAVEKAREADKENLNRVPTLLDREAKRIIELFDEKLKAAKELTLAYITANNAAITKSETATTKEIDSIKLLIGSVKAASDEQDRNLEKRLDGNERTTANSAGMFAGGHGVITLIVAIVAAAGVYITSHNAAPDKRIDDVQDRINALSARINTLTPPPATPRTSP